MLQFLLLWLISSDLVEICVCIVFPCSFTQVSKDVRKLRHFEQTLVVEYRLFLSLCDETIKGVADILYKQVIDFYAISVCMCAKQERCGNKHIIMYTIVIL